MNCLIEGCEGTVHSRGWCRMHYQRWWRHGAVGSSESLRGGPVACSIDGCVNDREARGLCGRHYYRIQHHGTAAGPACWACSADPNSCVVHRPTVCVCDVPQTGPATGQCANCARPYWVRSSELQLSKVREAWRQYLADEGVYEFHVAAAAEATT